MGEERERVSGGRGWAIGGVRGEGEKGLGPRRRLKSSSQRGHMISVKSAR